MARFGLIGGSYQSQSPVADSEDCMNWYVENMETPFAKSKACLYPVPGYKLFATLQEPMIGGLFTQNGRLFSGCGSLYEVFADGSSNKFGSLQASSSPVIMAGSQTEILINAGGSLWLFNLANNFVAPIDMSQLGGSGNIQTIGFKDGFFVSLLKNSQTLQLSDLLDGSTWNGLNKGIISIFPDNINSMLVDHNEIWLWGSKNTAVYYDTGAAFFPIGPIPGVYLEIGSGAPFGATKLDNSCFWWSLDDRGSMVAYRGEGYNPKRVSTHAIENLVQGLSTSSDIVAYAYQDQGHTFWVNYFPTANLTLTYDAATGMWHKRSFFTQGKDTAHRSWCHTFAFGKHLVGDPLSGNIYEMSIKYADDAGNPIRRLRRSPPISIENRWIYHSQVVLDVETGVGPQPPLSGSTPLPNGFTLQSPSSQLWKLQVLDDGRLQVVAIATGVVQALTLNDLDTGLSTWTIGVNNSGQITTTAVAFNPAAVQNIPLVGTGGQNAFNLSVDSSGRVEAVELGQQAVARDPQIFLRWSDDGGRTWSQYYGRDCGQAGQYSKRVIWRRLGRSRNRVYEITASDPIPWRIIDAYLEASPSYGPTERMSSQMGKGA